MTFKQYYNDKPFSYRSRFGHEFSSERCDFKGSILIKEPKISTSELVGKKLLALDLAEMIGYHATNIWPELNGFQGYDCLKLEFV